MKMARDDGERYIEFGVQESTDVPVSHRSLALALKVSSM